MNYVKVKSWHELDNILENFSGILEYDTQDLEGALHIGVVKTWYRNGLVHREDGPARIVDSKKGKKREEWWLNGILLSEEQYNVTMMFSEESREKLYKNNNFGLKNLFSINIK